MRQTLGVVGPVVGNFVAWALITMLPVHKCRYLCACDYVGCADALCNGTLRKNNGQGIVNPE